MHILFRSVKKSSLNIMLWKWIKSWLKEYILNLWHMMTFFLDKLDSIDPFFVHKNLKNGKNRRTTPHLILFGSSWSNLDQPSSNLFKLVETG